MRRLLLVLVLAGCKKQDPAPEHEVIRYLADLKAKISPPKPAFKMIAVDNDLCVLTNGLEAYRVVCPPAEAGP